MSTPTQPNEDILLILQRVWGHANFRPLQREIIDSVLAGKDTLALLPTGGGKSVCYQLPALALPGLCIVVSPLIALMHDQVEQLRRRKVEAQVIHSGMMPYEIGQVFEACLDERRAVKLLYLSPERLKSALVQERIAEMKVSFVAVDEAHCISQWGHDFRPAYREFAQLRQILPHAAILAVTATATPQVAEDIRKTLVFRRSFETFTGSYARPNLSFSVFNEDHKERKVEEILEKVPGTSIIYARSRRRAEELAAWLKARRVGADYLHAGLSVQVRKRKQEAWMAGRLRVLVATTAFGMGVDKPDVRTVIHIDLPESPEAYFQEAGRAGRDGHRSYAVLLFNEGEAKKLLKRIDESYPGEEDLRHLYLELCQHLRIPRGEGELESFPFAFAAFQKKTNWPPGRLLGGLKRLEDAGLITMSDAIRSPARVRLLLDTLGIYNYRIQNPQMEGFLNALMRIYGGGMFTDYMPVREDEVGLYLNLPADVVAQNLAMLAKRGVIDYQPADESPRITFLTQRLVPHELPLRVQNFYERMDREMERAGAVLEFAREPDRCRMGVLTTWFGQVLPERCGICDNCLKAKKHMEYLPNPILREAILNALSSPASERELISAQHNWEARAMAHEISYMLENRLVQRRGDGRLVRLAL